MPTFQTGGFGTSLGAFQIEQDSSATQIIGTEGKVGDALPDFQMSFSNDVLVWAGSSFAMLLDWKQGGDIVNLTEFLYDAGQNSVDFETAGRQRQIDFGNGHTQTYVQDGSYLKLREVTLAYNLPENITRGLFGSSVRYARLSLSGRQPAPVHRLSRSRPRGEQLRQPVDRAKHRRRAVPADAQLLLLR